MIKDAEDIHREDPFPKIEEIFGSFCQLMKESS